MFESPGRHQEDTMNKRKQKKVVKRANEATLRAAAREAAFYGFRYLTFTKEAQSCHPKSSQGA